MVNFKKVMILGLGLILSVNSFGFNKGDKGNSGNKRSIAGLGAPTKQVIEEKSSSIEQDIKVNLGGLFYFGLKEASGVLTCTNKGLDDFFKREDVIKSLFAIVFDSKVNDNILFYVLKKAGYAADKVLFFKYFINIAKNRLDKAAFSSLINKTISFTDNGENCTYSLFTLAYKNLNGLGREFEIVANAILDCSDALGKEALCIKPSAYKESFINCVLSLKDAAKKQDYLAKIFRINGVFEDKVSVRQGNGDLKEKSLLCHLIHEREFELVKNILLKFEDAEFNKIKNKDLLLHEIISSIGYEFPKDRKEQDVSAGLELIEFLIKEKKVDVNFKKIDDKGRTPLLVLSRDLEGSVEHKKNPRRILTTEVIKVLDILLENRADLFIKDSEFKKNFIEWILSDILVGLREIFSNISDRGDISGQLLTASRLNLFFHIKYRLRCEFEKEFNEVSNSCKEYGYNKCMFDKMSLMFAEKKDKEHEVEGFISDKSYYFEKLKFNEFFKIFLCELNNNTPLCDIELLRLFANCDGVMKDSEKDTFNKYKTENKEKIDQKKVALENAKKDSDEKLSFFD